MKKTSRSSTGRVAVVLGMTAIAGLAGCELLVDFDRSLIDAGLGDASFTDGATQDATGDVTLTDTSPGVDSAQDSANDSPASETGTDGGDGSTGDDSGDAGDGATTTDANDAGVDAADANVVDAADAADAAETAPTAASFSIMPTSYPFMVVDAGTMSAETSFTVTNNGGTDGTNVVVSFTGTDMGDFHIGSTDMCSGQTVAANGGTCSVAVNFLPTAASGTMESATLNVAPATGTAGTAGLTGTSN